MSYLACENQLKQEAVWLIGEGAWTRIPRKSKAATHPGQDPAASCSMAIMNSQTSSGRWA